MIPRVRIDTEEPPREPQGPSADDAMARYGIARVRVDRFHYGEYRYSRLGDAIAQAERDAKASNVLLS